MSYEIEEVESVATPPKVRVETVAETLDRKRDYLEGFLAQKPPVDPAGSASPSTPSAARRRSSSWPG